MINALDAFLQAMDFDYFGTKMKVDEFLDAFYELNGREMTVRELKGLPTIELVDPPVAEVPAEVTKEQDPKQIQEVKVDPVAEEAKLMELSIAAEKEASIDDEA